MSIKPHSEYGLDGLQKTSIALMAVLVLLTFIGANLHAVLWQSSQWLVSTVLPAVVVELTNEERTDQNTAPLVRNKTLDRAATLKAQHMAENEYFSHYSPEGVSPWFWFREAGYTYAHAGENLAIHFTDSSEVVEAWMDSPTHRANIVDSKYTEIGVGTARGEFEGYDTVYVVQLFGAPAVVPETPIIPVIAEEPEPVLNEQPVVVAEEPVVLATQPEVPVEDSTESMVAANTPELLAAEEPLETFVTAEEAVVTIETSLIATSSGLAVANIVQETPVAQSHAIASIATQPNLLLQWVYMIIGVLVALLLGASLVLEARRLHFVQVAYSMVLLVGMGALWFTHMLLTEGAVIV